MRVRLTFAAADERVVCGREIRTGLAVAGIPPALPSTGACARRGVPGPRACSAEEPLRRGGR